MRMPNEAEVSKEQRIKHAVIDLLHAGEEVTLSALSKATGISLIGLEEHAESIDAMLSRLKKAHTSPQFKQ